MRRQAAPETGDDGEAVAHGLLAPALLRRLRARHEPVRARGRARQRRNVRGERH